jgi:hypothetical protein
MEEATKRLDRLGPGRRHRTFGCGPPVHIEYGLWISADELFLCAVPSVIKRQDSMNGARRLAATPVS